MTTQPPPRPLSGHILSHWSSWRGQNGPLLFKDAKPKQPGRVTTTRRRSREAGLALQEPATATSSTARAAGECHTANPGRRRRAGIKGPRTQSLPWAQPQRLTSWATPWPSCDPEWLTLGELSCSLWSGERQGQGSPPALTVRNYLDNPGEKPRRSPRNKGYISGLSCYQGNTLHWWVWGYFFHPFPPVCQPHRP